MAKGICSVGGCEREIWSRGYCNLHYQRFRRHGDPTAGRLPNGSTLRERFSEYHTVQPGGCWLWTGAKNDQGYGQLWIEGKLRYAHRLSHELHVGEIPRGKRILHRCDNPPCVNPAHLFLGTQADNVADMVAKGRARGGVPKLTESQKSALRERPPETGEQVLALARRLGVAKTTIYHYANGG